LPELKGVTCILGLFGNNISSRHGERSNPGSLKLKNNYCMNTMFYGNITTTKNVFFCDVGYFATYPGSQTHAYVYKYMHV
jgi:hypothetical protein